MLKPIAAGLMCLGFVTLGVVATRGQEKAEEPKSADVIVVGEEKEKPAPAALPKAKSAGENVFEIRIGEDGDAAVVEKGEKKNADGAERIEVIIQDDDGKTLQTLPSQPRTIRAAARARIALPTIDPGTRQALEKLIADVKEEAKRLETEGKKDEAGQKAQSLQALEQLLMNPRPRGGGMFNQPLGLGLIMQNRLADETKSLQARLAELTAQASKNQEGEAQAKIQQEIADLQLRLAERQRQLQVAAQQPGTPLGQRAPTTPYQPGNPGQPGNQRGGGMGGSAYSDHVDAFTRWAEGSPEAASLMRKSHALSQAANQLQQAGLENQSRELNEQAEKLREEAGKLRAQAMAQRQGQPGFGGGGSGGFPGGPPMELHRSILELREQIQQLRKEVGELRELLQQTRK